MPMMVAPKASTRPTSAPGVAKAKPKAPAKAKSVAEIDAKLKRLGPYPMVTGPYDADDYDALTRRRLDWTAQRSRLLQQRHERSKAADTEALKAKNQPTVEVAVDDPEAKKRARKNLTRVRQSEAWRYRQLTPMQRQAEIEMETAWRSRTEGMGAAVSKYGAVGGGRDAMVSAAAMDGTWRDWMAMAPHRGVHVSALIDCLTEPKTLAEVEKERKLKPGNALANYQQGLDLWSELRGWTRGS